VVSTDDILNTIDRAIWDTTTSPDAMRWTPEVASEVAPDPIPVAAEALRWLEVLRLFRSLEEPRPPTRVVDEHRDGSRLVPFVGGTYHGSVLRLPMDPGYAWNIPEPETWTARSFFEPGEPYSYDPTFSVITYRVRRMWMHVPPLPGRGLYRSWDGLALVCVHGEPSEPRVYETLKDAMVDGWRPWIYPHP
jgi:hypothetical protein